MKLIKKEVSIIVGAFQTPKLTSEHKKLFDRVVDSANRVVCIICLAPIKGSTTNFLDWHQRVKMIQEDYPSIDCLYINDTKSDSVWAKNLDKMITSIRNMPGESPLLYGSEFSFIKKYKDAGGKFECEVLEATDYTQMAEFIRAESRSSKANYHVRLGMLMASTFRYPTAYTTVDIAIMDQNRTKIWLGRKEDEVAFRFIGGFSDPDSFSLEDDATREVMEETGIEVSYPEYICSMRIDDWRYRNEVDCIKTTFWIADRIGGQPKAADDIVEIKLFDIKDFMWEEGEAPIDKSILRNGKALVRGHHGLMLELVEQLGWK